MKRTGVKEVYIFKFSFHSFKMYIEEEMTKVRLKWWVLWYICKRMNAVCLEQRTSKHCVFSFTKLCTFWGDKILSVSQPTSENVHLRYCFVEEVQPILLTINNWHWPRACATYNFVNNCSLLLVHYFKHKLYNLHGVCRCLFVCVSYELNGWKTMKLFNCNIFHCRN